jgi:hypothetical protein
MKKLNNRQFNQIVALFLVFVSVSGILTLIHFDDSDNILNNYFDDNSSSQINQFKAISSRKQQSFIAVLNKNSLEFKVVKSYNSNLSSNLEVDFPTMTNPETATHNRIQNSNTNSMKNEVMYSYNQTKTSPVNTSKIQFTSTKTNDYSSSKPVFSNITGDQLEGNFRGKSQSNSNNVLNAFSSNNTLSLTTDLSDNTSPMMIDGGTNPGDPGVPVGDGTWVMLFWVGIYVLTIAYKRFKLLV